MKKALKTVLVAICGLTVLTFGRCVIVTHSKAEQKTLCIGFAAPAFHKLLSSLKGSQY